MDKSYPGIKQAYKERAEVEAKRMGLDPIQPTQCGVTETHYTAFDALDWSDVMIHELADRIERLANVIYSVMEEPGPQCAEDSRPRVTNTPVIARITAQGEALENLNRRVEDMIGRVRL